MASNVLNNVKEKLSKSRELCEGMSERAYLFADYMSEISPNTITPPELAECLQTAVTDIRQEERWRKIAKKGELRWQLSFIAKKIANQAINFPQIIDVIANEDFAQEFRAICKENFNINPPKYASTEFIDYPESVKVAVIWWTNVISLLKTTSCCSSVSNFLSEISIEQVNSKSYSNEDLHIFQATLASEILEDITAWKTCILSVEYTPCNALETAGNKIGVSNLWGYPFKTSMTISKSKVRIKVGDSMEFKTLWTSN